MHKKISIGLTITISAIAIIVTALVTTAVTMNIFSSLVSDLPQRESMYVSLAEIDNLIRNEYYGSVDDDSLNSSIADGYLSNLTTGSNYIMSAEEYDEYKKNQSGKDKYGNIIKSVTYSIDSNAGYIKISDFTDKTPDEFSDALTNLKNESVSGIIIDVRNTDSINIKSAALIIDMLVPVATSGTQAIATAVDKNNTNTVVFAADAESVDIPVAVLVNEKTSGAGELLACDIKDFGIGTVVGKTTAGNGSYQKIFELEDGGALVLTTAKLMPYKSDCYDAVGVSPDYEIEQKESTEDLAKDNQYQHALAWIMTKQKF